MMNFVVLCLVLLSLFNPLMTTRQDAAGRVNINNHANRVAETGVDLQLYFTLLGDDGWPLSTERVQIANAEIVIDGGAERSYPAEVRLPPEDAPLYIVLVLDASGSMGRAMPDMRAAATQFVNEAPDNARLALLGFNDSIVERRSFTTNVETILDGIQMLEARNEAGTCLYDTTIEAIELLTQTTEARDRGAVVVFTDGADETIDQVPCSQAVRSDVISRAANADTRVPLYTIGMETDRLDAETVNLMAQQTNGLAVIGGQADLGDLFGNIVSGLNNQWFAEANVWADSGEHTATLTIETSDGRRFQPGEIIFNVEGQPIPDVTISNVDAVPYEEDGVIEFNFEIEGEEHVESYKVELYDENGAEVLTARPSEWKHGLIVIAAPENLEAGRYRAVIIALDAEGANLAQSNEVSVKWQGKGTTPTPELPGPIETPCDVSLFFSADQDDEGAIVFDVETDIEGDEDCIGGYQLIFIDQNSGREAMDDNFNSPPNRLRAEEHNLPEGRYTVILSALDENEDEIVSKEETIEIYDTGGGGSPTPIPTPVIDVLQPEPNARPLDYVLQVGFEVPDLAQTYKIDLINARTGVLSQSLESTPQEQVPISFQGLPEGEYRVRFVIFGEGGRELARSEVRIAPPTPTPTPSPTASPTPTLTPTPIVVTFTLNLMPVDQNTLPIQVQPTNGADLIDSYRVEVRRGIQLMNEVNYDVPLDGILPLSLDPLEPGDYTIRVVALDENRQPIDPQESVEVPYAIEPTPAPDVTCELTPLDGDMRGVEYILNIPCSQGWDLIHTFELELFDQNGVLQYEQTYEAPRDAIGFSFADVGKELEAENYLVRITARDEAGIILARMEQAIPYNPPTPTPTITPTPEASPTPTPEIQCSAWLEESPDKPEEELLVKLDVTGQEYIAQYKLEVVNNEGIRVQETQYDPPPDNAFVLTLEDYETGEHTVQITGLDEEGEPVCEPPGLGFGVPEPPDKTFFEKGVEFLRENPPVIIIIVIVLLALVVLLIVLMRQGDSEDYGGSIIDETGPYTPPAAGPAQPASGGMPGPMPGGFGADPDKTNPVGVEILTIPARLTIQASLDKSKEGRTFTINTTPYVIGRHKPGLTLDLTLDDDRVSRPHAEIRYERGEFLVADLGSTHGTMVDGARIRSPTILRNGAVIGVGGTKIEFNYDDPDKTNPQPTI